MRTKVVELDTYRDKPKVMRSNTIIPGMDTDYLRHYEFEPCKLCQIKCKDGGMACFALDLLVDLASEADVDKLLERMGMLRRCFNYVEYEVPRKD